MWEEWVVDVTFHKPDNPELLCFIPVEGVDTDSPTFVTGLMYGATIESFDRGRLRGIIHMDGDEAVERWMQSYPELTERIKAKCL